MTAHARTARPSRAGRGAYCGEGGFFAQMAAMHAPGPYELERADVESSLVYSNNQPSSSIRAPTAPQVCWALEQHMDELAEALELDPVELRRRTLIEEGSVTATGQVLERIAMKETLERAVELIGAATACRTNEAIGMACGWWPCFPAKAGAYVKLNGDGTGTIVTGAQENGTGAVMALPRYVAEELGMEPEDFSLLYQDTDAAPWDNGSCGSQTTFNSARAVLAAAVEVREQLLDAASETLEAARDDLELVAGSVRVKGSPEKAVTIAALAAEATFHGKGAGPVPESPPAPAEGCVGRLGARVVPRATADCARGACPCRPRDRRRPCAPGRGGARLRAHPQPGRSRRPGLRRRRDGDRAGAQRGDAARRAGPPAQPPPARLQARHGARTRRRSRSTGSRRTRRTPARRARRASASRRASRPPERSRTRSPR